MLDGLIISIDAMGGDAAPDIVIKGIEYFLTHEGEGRRARFLLHGDAEKLAPLLKDAPRTRERSEVFHTDKVVEMDDKPSQALTAACPSCSCASLLEGQPRDPPYKLTLMRWRPVR